MHVRRVTWRHSRLLRTWAFIQVLSFAAPDRKGQYFGSMATLYGLYRMAATWWMAYPWGYEGGLGLPGLDGSLSSLRACPLGPLHLYTSFQQRGVSSLQAGCNWTLKSNRNVDSNILKKLARLGKFSRYKPPPMSRCLSSQVSRDFITCLLFSILLLTVRAAPIRNHIHSNYA